MDCPKCSVANDQDALFCKNCGNPFFSEQAVPKNENKIFDVILFISIAYWFAMDLINLLIRNLIGDWYDSPFRYIQIGTNLIYAAVPVFIALSIKKTGLKIPAIIFSALISCYILFNNIDWLVRGLI